MNISFIESTELASSNQTTIELLGNRFTDSLSVSSLPS